MAPNNNPTMLAGYGPANASENEKTGLLQKQQTTAAATMPEKEHREGWKIVTVSLCLTMLTQSYILISVFPYSGYLAMHLIPGLNSEDAGSYAGLVSSSFMIGRTFSSFEWGRASDKYGRKRVIQASLFLSAIFSVLFGMAPTMRWALFWRCMLGASNGIMSSVKTVLSEYPKGDKVLETKMMALALGMWGYGFLICPAISGYLSDPVRAYPDSQLVQAFEPWLSAFPFVLPNLVGAFLCMASFFAVTLNVEETLAEEKRQPFTIATLFNLKKKDNGAAEVVEVPRGESSLSQVEKPKQNNEHEPVTMYSIWKRKSTRQHLILYWTYSFLLISIDESFPLFCISHDSGLGLSEQMIGNILSGTGVFYVLIQYFLITGLVKQFGVYGALRLGTVFSIPFAMFIPFSLYLNRGETEADSVNLVTYCFVAVSYSMVRTFSSVVFSGITIAVNKTVPSHMRATMQGFSMLGGSLAKATGPAFAGSLFAFSVSSGLFEAPWGSVFAFCLIGFMGCLHVILSFQLEEFDPNAAEREAKKSKENSASVAA
mmetsp:Transcript_24535/g.37855  ORF Transcript_24535/g.37855 Transcript_24535/m.37855 type:complete len:543 (+) Transcript_24535:31-1659(+)